MARFFIARPIFAAVLSIVVTLAGGVAVVTLPIAQYPEIAPPTVQVSCTYPGASAEVVAETVAAPIEQQVNGVENMLYMSSQCTNDGSYNLTVTFKLGIDLNQAQVLVQNRVSLAVPTLPDVVKQTGVTTKKKSPNILLVVNLISPQRRYDQLYLSNYATIKVKDELARLPGVGDVNIFGQKDYSMRVWLDPEQLATRNLTAGDVANAVKSQNSEIVAGRIGQSPVPAGQQSQYPLVSKGRLTQPEEFGDIVVKPWSDGTIVRVRDIGHVELGAKNQDQSCSLDRSPAVGLAIYQLPDSNGLETAEFVRKKMEQLKAEFPDDLEYKIVHDTTPFIEESIREVFHSLRDAVILVAVVVLVFLQSWRSTLIPLIAVPVAIVGTFAAMAAIGFGLNNLTLFGLVLAIGIVVDDAIVVVEAVEHHIEHGLSPRDATLRAMEEVSGPVIAVALVLVAVFVPCAFITGITGQFFRQFAVTISVSTVLSALNSLTLSPALCALLLRPRDQLRDPLTRIVNAMLGWFFRLFNATFGKITHAYLGIISRCLRVAILFLALYGGLLYLTGLGFQTLPTGFIPPQDKGYLLVNVQLPDSASLERTIDVVDHVEEIAHNIPGIAHSIGISGYSVLMSANGSNFATLFIILDSFHERHTHGQKAYDIAMALQRNCIHQIQEARVNVFGAPPVDGLGNAGGFKLMIEDRGDGGLQELQRQTDALIAEGNSQHELVGLFTMSRANTPQLFVDIDRTKCMAMGVPINSVFQTLQVYLGSLYVNDFNLLGRTWQVNLQADAAFRRTSDAVGQLKVRNRKGEMVPLATIAAVRDRPGPVMVMRYNTYPATAINGSVAPGRSSGEAIRVMGRLSKDLLPQSMTTEWTELTLMQLLAGNTAMYVFGMAVVLVFLVLAAQYESWSLPLAVILVVPMCLLCSIAGVALMKQDINIFTQIGFVVLVGLASKNAILIVEFAKSQREAGVPVREATLEACKLRLRPIIMTSLAFILGVVPLLVSSGAGSEMRKTLGLAVFSGMLGVTLFGLLLTPIFYFVIQRVGESRACQSKTAQVVSRLLWAVLCVGLLGIPYALQKSRRRQMQGATEPPGTPTPTDPPPQQHSSGATRD
ncbi:MAG: multidrug efflux RND transporter permease subunit [Planctomycetes bacterium]|nr:multidrug efflux RND transporter permease subunit [Planctomycetota bacterium]